MLSAFYSRSLKIPKDIFYFAELIVYKIASYLLLIVHNIARRLRRLNYEKTTTDPSNTFNCYR